MALNPLSSLSADDLWNAQVLLQMICNRGKFAYKKKHVAPLCLLGTKLELEAGQRGAVSPAPPLGVGRLKL